MKEIVAELFGRFVASLPSGSDAPLYAHEVQAVDARASSATPFHTVVICGRHDGQDGPLAVVLLESGVAVPLTRAVAIVYNSPLPVAIGCDR
jgi:hypothetical protein